MCSGRTTLSVLNATESFTLKWLILFYVNFTSIFFFFFKKKGRSLSQERAILLESCHPACVERWTSNSSLLMGSGGRRSSSNVLWLFQFLAGQGLQLTPEPREKEISKLPSRLKLTDPLRSGFGKVTELLSCSSSVSSNMSYKTPERRP